MATVTGFTADRMLAIENDTIVDGKVQGNNLILTRKGGSTVNAGNVRGSQGPVGPAGEVSTATLNAAISNLQDQINAGPRLVGHAQTSAEQSWAFSAGVWGNVTGLSVTFNVTEGRRYLFTANCLVESWASNTDFDAHIFRTGGSGMARGSSRTKAANNGVGINISKTYTAPAGWAGSQTFFLQMRFDTAFEVRVRNGQIPGTLSVVEFAAP